MNACACINGHSTGIPEIVRDFLAIAVVIASEKNVSLNLHRNEKYRVLISRLFISKRIQNLDCTDNRFL